MNVQRVAAVFGLWAGMAAGQSFTPVREQKNLSPAALATLRTLEGLNALPAGEWRFHAGDVAHGEAVGLDDAGWAKVTAPAKAPKEAVWYRREITVPKTLNGYDITGQRVWFQFRADANGPMPQIVYFNGRRVALGDDLEPIVLFEPARAGETVLVAVKLLHTVDEKTFKGVTLRVEAVEGAGGAARPSPEDVRLEAIAAANLLPALAVPRADLLPKVEQAVAAIDVKALGAGDQARFDASLRKAQGMLAGLHGVLAGAKVVEAGNSHIDAAWLWPRSETIDVVKRTFTTALQLMNEYPEYTFTQSAAQYTEWMADKYPELNEQIKARVKEGRWEIVGGMWVEPDLNIPDGESLVRQLLVGQRYFQKQYGVTARIGWNPDSFGYNWQLPQIYKRSGMDYFVTQKMHWNDTNRLPFRLFWWESPDGSKVLTYFPTDYVHDNVSPTRVSADFADSAGMNPGTGEMLDLYGIGDHGGGPTRAMLDQADHWMGAGKQGAAVPAMRYGTAQQYFSDVEGTLGETSTVWDYDRIAKGYTAPVAGAGGGMGVPTWKDELYFEYHRGIYTTQAAQKRDNRKSEVATLDAEKLASLAWLGGRSYPAEELTENWKKITFNQFHDLAAGSGIAVIYRDAQKDYGEVFRSDREIAGGAREALTAGVDTRVKAGVPVMVVNTEAWPRSEVVEVSVQTPDAGETVAVLDAKDEEVPSQVISEDAATHQFGVLARVSVPALGYAVLHVVPGRKKSMGAASMDSDLSSDGNPARFIVRNSHVEVTVDRKTGCITSLKSLPARTEFLAPNACGNQLQTFVDTPKQYDAWNIDPGTLDHMTPIDQVDSVTQSDGRLRKTIDVTRHWQGSRFVQEISLDAGADAVRVENDIDWHETHVLLKVAFPLAASEPKATYEIPFGSIERTTVRENSWEKAKFEVPALRWADLGDARQGVSILNDSKYGYDAVGNVLRLTLLRSPMWPDAEADRGAHHFVYAIYPHAGGWKQAQTVRHGYELNDPMTAVQVMPHAGALGSEHSYGAVENANVTLTAVKKAEDADALVFRMYEWAGTAGEVKLHVPPGAQYAVETNLMEKVEGAHLPVTGDVVTVRIAPYEILTVQVVYATGVRDQAPGVNR